MNCNKCGKGIFWIGFASMGGSHSNYYKCVGCGRIYEIYDRDYNRSGGITLDKWVVQWGDRDDDRKEWKIHGWNVVVLKEHDEREGEQIKISTHFFDWAHTRKKTIRYLEDLLNKLKEDTK